MCSTHACGQTNQQPLGTSAGCTYRRADLLVCTRFINILGWECDKFIRARLHSTNKEGRLWQEMRAAQALQHPLAAGALRPVEGFKPGRQAARKRHARAGQQAAHLIIELGGEARVLEGLHKLCGAWVAVQHALLQPGCLVQWLALPQHLVLNDLQV